MTDVPRLPLETPERSRSRWGPHLGSQWGLVWGSQQEGVPVYCRGVWSVGCLLSVVFSADSHSPSCTHSKAES